jgi:hypothetical protein
VSHIGLNLSDTPETPETLVTLEPASHFDTNVSATSETPETLVTLVTLKPAKSMNYQGEGKLPQSQS